MMIVKNHHQLAWGTDYTVFFDGKTYVGTVLYDATNFYKIRLKGPATDASIYIFSKIIVCSPPLCSNPGSAPGEDHKQFRSIVNASLSSGPYVRFQDFFS
jgi:hypothetical protein